MANIAKQMWAALGAVGAIAIIKQAIDASAEQEIAMKRLSGAIENAGYSWDEVNPKVLAFMENIKETTAYTDNETIDAFKDLMIYTSDIDKAMQGAKIAMDMASSGMFDLTTASQYVGQAMAGNIGRLQRYIPELKSLKEEQFKQLPAMEKADFILGLLQKKFGGMAEDELATFTGATKQMRNEWNDLLANLGNTITQSPLIVQAINDITDTIDALNKKLSDEGLGGTLIELWKRTSPLGIIISELQKWDKTPEQGEPTITSGAENTSPPKETDTYWQDLAKQVLESYDLIKSIESEYGDWKKNLLLEQKLYFVQQEAAQIDILLKSKTIDAETEEKLFEKKRELILAEAKLKKQIFISYLQSSIAMGQATASLLGELATMTGEIWLKQAEIIVNTIVSVMEVIIIAVNSTLGPLGWIRAAIQIATISVAAINAFAQIEASQKALEQLKSTTATPIVNVPALAGGGDIFGAGFALVGERGPELLNLPRGARVSPLTTNIGETHITITINLAGAFIGAEEIADQILPAIKDRLDRLNFYERRRF